MKSNKIHLEDINKAAKKALINERKYIRKIIMKLTLRDLIHISGLVKVFEFKNNIKKHKE
jgi:hypothetical protein